MLDGVDGGLDEDRLILHDLHTHIFRQRGGDLVESQLHFVRSGDGVRAGLLQDRQRDRGCAVEAA